MSESEFGRRLRLARGRVAPEAVGIPAGSRRRTAGLRREELAGLAGISVDYLTRLEQGRASSPSAQVVEALARALRLAEAERDQLFALAGLAPSGSGLVRTRIAPSVQRLLDRFDGIPVVVYDAAWNLIQANAPYDALMGDTSALAGRERNGVWRNLLGSGSRARQTTGERDELVAGLVADLRMTAARHPADAALQRLVGDLRAASPRFVDLWETAIAPIAGEYSRHKVIEHPVVGPIELDCDTLVVAGDDLRLMVYTVEPGTADAERLAMAIVLGTQRFGDGEELAARGRGESGRA